LIEVALGLQDLTEIDKVGSFAGIPLDGSPHQGKGYLCPARLVSNQAGEVQRASVIGLCLENLAVEFAGSLKRAFPMIFKSPVEEARGGCKPVGCASATLVLLAPAATGAGRPAPDAYIRAL
jgi:hypothetical protein